MSVENAFPQWWCSASGGHLWDAPSTGTEGQWPYAQTRSPPQGFQIALHHRHKWNPVLDQLPWPSGGEKVAVPSREAQAHVGSARAPCSSSDSGCGLAGTTAPCGHASKRVTNNMIKHKQPNLTTQGSGRQEQNGNVLPGFRINYYYVTPTFLKV